MAPLQLAGKRIVVTGAASGIGAATVGELRSRGATVIAVDRHPTDAGDEFRRADLADRAQLDRLIDELPDGLDGLCNIAGLPPTAPAELVVRVNVIALRELSERLIPKMADGASITHLASLAGTGWADAIAQVDEVLALSIDDDVAEFCGRHRLDEGGRSYFLSKEAVQVYTMRNRWTWRDRGIRMNCISPGPVDTPILADFIATLGDRADDDMALMDRPGTPADIAPVVAFLQSEDSRWFRGANLNADGGMSSHIALHVHGAAEG